MTTNQLNVHKWDSMTYWTGADITWWQQAQDLEGDRLESEPQSCFLMATLPTLPRLSL